MAQKIKKILIFASLVIAIFAVARFAMAAGPDLGLSYAEGTGLSAANDPRVIAAKIIRIVLGFLGLIAIGLIIYAGWLWMTAAGEADKIEKAKKILINAVIGLVIILSAFAIASFILSKLLGATGGGGDDGTVCEPACGSGQYCCNSSCSNSPCGPPGGGDSFNISSTIPRNLDTDVIRNVIIKVFFNKTIGQAVSQAVLDNNFKVEKIAVIDPATKAETAVSPVQLIAGAITLVSDRREINFKSKAACGDEKNTPNCLSEWSKFKVTVDGNSGIISVNGQSLNCSAGANCQFVFSTGDAIDTSGPKAGILPAQICRDDGALSSIPNANLVNGWAKDDVGVSDLRFCSLKQGGTENCLADSVKIGGLGQTYLSHSYKYDTSGYNIGDNYIFRAKASDLAGQIDKAEFSAKIRAGHCCNGVKDANETDVDCGGECGACDGAACASDMSAPAVCSDNLCASQVCRSQGSTLDSCAKAGYAAGTASCCLCQRPPVITGLSPTGGFCANDINKACLADSDCGAGIKCDVNTANGAAGNIITIHGRNFGTVKSLLENVLTNVDFEQGAIGGVPVDWLKYNQNHSAVGISQAEKKSGAQSVLIHQDPNQVYPGTCTQEICNDMGSCTWLAATNQCRFAAADDCHAVGPSIYNQGQILCWGNTHRVMWAKLVYNVSSLKWQAGEKYLIEFYYKGKNVTKISVILGYSLGDASQCGSFSSAWGKANCDEVNGPAAGYKTCENQPNYCCTQAPFQKKCYTSIGLNSIPAGNYNDWTKYSALFTYNQAMAELLDKNGVLKNEIGLTIGYNNTGAAGTDFYLDDFKVARVPSSGNVMFLGAADGGADDLPAVFPSDINPLCASFWQDDRITVVVPDGAKAGPIKVTAESGLADQTNDDNLPKIPDFIVNTIDRPGICQMDKNHGLLNETINYYGLKMSDAKAYFGDWPGKIPALNSTVVNDQRITAKVPNIIAGRTSSFVVKTNKKVYSNYLDFYKDEEPYKGPFISSFDPREGAAGQYITINGGGFGKNRGASQVYFGALGGAEANFDFPQICADSIWSDQQVIVKVPAGLANGNYKITMKIGAWPAIDTNSIQPAVNFKADSALPLKPSLCKINPIIGKVNSQVNLYGEYFGKQDNNSQVRFQFNRDQTILDFWNQDDDPKISGIKPDKIITKVPVSAVTGPVRAVKGSPELVGNGLNFTVGVCQNSAECGSGSLCCLAGTPYAGQCKIGEAEQEVCFPEIKACVYEWNFSTGGTGGGIGEPCDKNITTPQCDKDDTMCQSGLVCDQASCVCKKPCNQNAPGSEQCKPDDDKCAGTNTPVCNLTKCLCECTKNEDCKNGQTCNPATNTCGDDDSSKESSCAGYVNQCSDSYFCPNSPGRCSLNNGGSSVDTGVKCGDETCKNLGRCLDKDGNNLCIYIYNSANKNIDNKCKKVSDTCDLTQACVSGYSKSLDKSKCLGAVCSACGDKFSCLAEDETGVCAAEGNVCPDNSSCDDNVCKDLVECLDADGNNLCSYSSSLNKCKKKSATCDLTGTVNDINNQPVELKCGPVDGKTERYYDIKQTINDINGQPVELKCGAVDDKTVWHYDSKQTCVSGYTKSIDKSKCLGAACAACSAGFICQKDTNGGICVSDINICPAGSSCDSAKNECVKTTAASCECCCNINQNNAKTGANPGCCVSLTCAGRCGSDVGKTTPATFGQCTGCTVKNAAGKVDQIASNAKCNCTGTSGKFCNMAGAGGLGVCLDCASLTKAEACSTEGASSCCVDAENKNACRGTDVATVKSPYAGDNNNYCAYYQCQTTDVSAACTGPVASSTWPTYKTQADCSAKCQPPPQFGRECSTYGSAKGQKTAEKTCDISQCANFSCLNYNGSGPTAPNSCGTCCCDPNKKDENDQCKRFINSKLSCLANKGSCSGGSRGLCCGCSKDSECDSDSSGKTGCGSSGDRCCQARPRVTNVVPADKATKICRNSLIKATFNQAMNINTFKTNIIVVGDYGPSPCPADTQYLTAVYKPSLFARLKFWLAKIPLVNKLFALEVKALTGNFCSVAGQVSGLIKTNADGKPTTDLEFRTQKALAADRQYYVIIKGDSDITDAVSNGVLSQDGIGMKGAGLIKINADGSETIENPVMFNGLSFSNAKVWSFTTMGENEVNEGICPLDRVEVKPSSYVFQTNENDVRDDNPDDKTTFNKIADSDLVFSAQAYAKNGQLLTATVDYNWDWTWASANPIVATAEKLAESFKAIVRAQEKVVDARTEITATASLTGTTITKPGTATVYVILCENIWPPPQNDADNNLIWQPWQDRAGNCTVEKDDCKPTNFSLYYCRDAGAASTVDDLPAILDQAVIRGSLAQQDILKEFYFFREEAQAAAGGFAVSALPQGGGISASWGAAADAVGYKIYYGTASGNYTNSVDAGNATSKEITGLTNGTKYYFALTSYNNKKVESDYSEERSIAPSDTEKPTIPVLSGTAVMLKTADLSWPANQDDTAFYKIYYGATSGTLGASATLDKNKCLKEKCELKINNLNSGTTYYFVISAIDSYNNESNKSEEIYLIIK